MELERLIQYHTARFGMITSRVWAPGRINLIGEHTDYNQGYVLPAAIDAGITMLTTFGGDVDQWEVYSGNLDQHRAFHRQDGRLPSDNFAKYLQALVNLLEEEEGIRVPGFRASLWSTIPRGGGLSSSAALTIGFVLAINHRGNHGWSMKKMAELAQYTEHRIGAHVGIMDPYAIVAGQKDHFTLIDCRTNKIEAIPSNLKDHGLLLIDTGVSHNLADSEYNDRRATCEAVLEKARLYREVRDVSDLKPEDLNNIRNRHPEVSIQEVKYVLEENSRVLAAVEALKSDGMGELGRLMYASHAGLRDQYRVSCAELDFLVEFGRSFGVTGARMMGGGFGGSTINLIRYADIELFKSRVRAGYQSAFGREPRFLVVSPADGGKVKLAPVS